MSRRSCSDADEDALNELGKPLMTNRFPRKRAMSSPALRDRPNASTTSKILSKFARLSAALRSATGLRSAS